MLACDRCCRALLKEVLSFNLLCSSVCFGSKLGVAGHSSRSHHSKILLMVRPGPDVGRTGTFYEGAC